MTLQEAIKLGEYEPERLSQFEEWHQLSSAAQHEYVQQAIENRRLQLRIKWAAIANAPNYSQKPELEEVVQNITLAQRRLQADEERLSLEFSRKL